MKFKSIFRAFMLVAAISSIAVSCKEDGPGESGSGNGTITGTVSDDLGNPIEAVSVSISDLEATAVTDAEGKYTISNVPIQTMTVTFEKEGYQTSTATVTASRFNSENTATVNATLANANAVITGKVLDGTQNSAPFAGVTVTLAGGSSTVEAVSGEDGTFSFENLTIRDYTLTFSIEGYVSSSATVTTAMFDNDAVTATVPDVTLYKTALLPGMTLGDLQNADSWYVNEYRGGKNNGGGVVDWSTVYMSTLDFRGNWENQNEGCTLQVLEEDAPANLDAFESFVFGKKAISADNNILTLYIRTHDASEDAPAYYGVQVIDLEAAEPTIEYVGDKQNTYASSDYSDVTFDLSKYNGKTVIVAVGIYRSLSGAGSKKQLVLRKMSFGPKANVEDGYVGDLGTEIADLKGWHMSSEMVKSSMRIEKTDFTGLPGTLTSSDIAKQSATGYYEWRESDHIAANWGFMYVAKDVEPHAGQGFVIKTNGGKAADLNTPESYFYGKFTIDDAHDNMVLYARNFDSNELNPTYFKVIAIDNDSNVTPIEPSEDSKVDNLNVIENGMVTFIHNRGEGDGDIEEYGQFSYDLSSFKGQDVVLAIAIFKGTSNNQEGEQKLSIRRVAFN